MVWPEERWKHWNKETKKKQTWWNLKGRALHWPNFTCIGCGSSKWSLKSIRTWGMNSGTSYGKAWIHALIPSTPAWRFISIAGVMFSAFFFFFIFVDLSFSKCFYKTKCNLTLTNIENQPPFLSPQDQGPEKLTFFFDTTQCFWVITQSWKEVWLPVQVTWCTWHMVNHGVMRRGILN